MTPIVFILGCGTERLASWPGPGKLNTLHRSTNTWYIATEEEHNPEIYFPFSPVSTSSVGVSINNEPSDVTEDNRDSLANFLITLNKSRVTQRALCARALSVTVAQDCAKTDALSTEWRNTLNRKSAQEQKMAVGSWKCKHPDKVQNPL